MKHPLRSFRLIISISALFFLLLFYSKSPGINTLLITCYSAGLWWFLRKESPGKTFYLLLGGTFVSSIGVLLGHSPFSIFIFWLCLLLFLGNFAYVQLRHIQFGPRILLYSITRVPGTFFNRITPRKKSSGINYNAVMKFVFLPVIIIIVLLVIYSQANEMFSKSMNGLLNHIGDLFSFLSVPRLLFALLGALIFTLCFIEIPYESILRPDQALKFDLVRIRIKTAFGTLNRLLLRKQQVAVILFVILNIMIAWLNFLDLKHIWFGFTWDGGFLKMMVHEGTYLLIVAVLISMAISIYYLQGNIIFLKNNRFFKTLVILWLAQNMVMVVSVAIRNNYYVEYFALAHKRIFVYFFLLLCIAGLVSIIVKIVNQKTTGFLVSVNSVAVYIVLLVSACFNWDAIIARYNFKHYDQSFVHYDYLLYLNDAALPYLAKTQPELEQIDLAQLQRFKFAQPKEYEKLDYKNKVESRIMFFKTRWEEKSWLEWNYPEQKAYWRLSGGG
jgi:hypothetical protein